MIKFLLRTIGGWLHAVGVALIALGHAEADDARKTIPDGHWEPVTQRNEVPRWN
jgi:hypothetical protein